MRIGEAYEKVTSEVSQTIAEQTGLETGVPASSFSLDDLGKLKDIAEKYVPHLYDGSAKDFIASRGKKRAQDAIDSLVEAGVDFTDQSVMEPHVDNLIDRWFTDMLQILAMGYTFASPEYADVPRDRDGFVQLCRLADRDLISIQVAQFSSDELLKAKIGEQMAMASALTANFFSMMGRSYNKYTLRDFLFQVWATTAMNAFIAGHEVRKLLEEEIAFEAMMKETD